MLFGCVLQVRTADLIFGSVNEQELYYWIEGYEYMRREKIIEMKIDESEIDFGTFEQ